MARPRQPVKLLEIKGKKHLTKEEIQSREASEVKPIPKGIKAPDYLSDTQKKTFRKLAKQLSQLEIMGETDNDALARLVIAQERFEEANKILNKVDFFDDPKEYETASRIYAKRIDELRKLASDLGLTISSRCKLVVPKAENKPPENKFNRFVV